MFIEYKMSCAWNKISAVAESFVCKVCSASLNRRLPNKDVVYLGGIRREENNP